MPVKPRHYVKFPRAAVQHSWTVPALCAAYSWPVGLGAGGTIAIVELGGGWNAADVTAAFNRMGLPEPRVTDVSVDGTTNNPGNDADAEVALDIQIAAASYTMATGVSADVRIYWSQDIAKAVRAAARDGCDVCSISWGAPEAEWGQSAVFEMNRVAVEAVHTYGMTIFAASGDNDADDGMRVPSVDCPACCPQVIGCGGTMKPRYGTETVWNNDPGRSNGAGSGGGYSLYFPRQVWQVGAPKGPGNLGRMVPDVAACADPDTGYEVVLNGDTMVIGGTSAVAPLYAGLVAAVGGKKPGWITPQLYANPGWFSDVSTGDNGTYTARTGPDACTGLGSPVGDKFKV